MQDELTKLDALFARASLSWIEAKRLLRHSAILTAYAQYARNGAMLDIAKASRGIINRELNIPEREI